MSQITTDSLVALGIVAAVATVIVAGIEEGKSRDELIIDAYNADKPAGVQGATSAVQKALVAAGLERTPKQKRTAWEDAITSQENYDLTDADFVAEALAAAEAEGIPVATAKRYLKEIAEEAQVELADVSARGDTKISILVDWFTEAYRTNDTINAKTIKAKCEEIGMTKASSQYYVNMFTKTLTILNCLNDAKNEAASIGQ